MTGISFPINRPINIQYQFYLIMQQILKIYEGIN